MIYQNEIVMLLICSIVLAFSIAYGSKLNLFPYWVYMYTSFLCLLAACICTVVEGFLFPTLFDLLEHLSYAASSLSVLIWTWKITQQPLVEKSK
ncbi:hypothetical protein N6H18_03035 [Reichenbachiella agarivorans]|uniref:Uncharacterized protein n=1 Tax=Reichenbachiella agarivorans TaxID=2979464 RepID=A0ABY6CRE4_9BACT|nr:hypothetical protein [Reichenbachiella agarivorans]UXP32929.1 hypothetical protein N6H18_03035 [Reichenbachiella agarivorans]